MLRLNGLVALLVSVILLSPSVYCLNPVVFFPGYGLSIFRVTVDNQSSVTDCPANGTYDIAFGFPDETNGFDISCMTRLLEISHTSGFSNLPGISIELLNYPNITCAPYYQEFYSTLEGAGYTPGVDLFAACYDWRSAPNVNVISGVNFIDDTFNLVKQAYENNGNSSVFLIGHSNGPIMAQYFINTLSQADKDKYIAGFLPYAGNWAGQGLFYGVLMQGLSVIDFSFLPETAYVYEGWTSSYFSLAQPEVFGDKIVLAQTPEKNYTSLDLDQLFEDSNLTYARQVYQDYIGLVRPAVFPYVPVVGFYGADIDTAVGIIADELVVGGPEPGLIFAPGDINQEYVTNEAFLVWEDMESEAEGCFTFTPHEYPGVNHFEVPSNADVLQKTLDVLAGVTPLQRGCAPSTGTTVTGTGTGGDGNDGGDGDSDAASSLHPFWQN